MSAGKLTRVANIKIELCIVISYSSYIFFTFYFFNFSFNILKHLNFVYFECMCVVCTHEVGGHPAGFSVLPTVDPGHGTKALRLGHRHPTH